MTVYPSKDSGFVGYGDADPSNVLPMVRRDADRENAGGRSRSAKRLLIPFPLWFAFLAWRPQTIGFLPHLCQGTLEKEFDLLIGRAVLALREFSDPRFQAGSYPDKHGDSGFLHFQITRNFLLLMKYRFDII